MPEQNQIHSTGRGGVGNIGKDATVYVPGDITREGVVGQPSHPGGGEYSAGRGGAGNMVLPKDVPTEQAGTVQAGSVETVPEPAMKAGEQYADFHTGGGGQGNVHRDKYGGHSKPQHEKTEGGLLEKAKHAIGLDKKKDGEKSAGT